MAQSGTDPIERQLIGEIAVNAIAVDAAIAKGDSLMVCKALMANRRAIDRWRAYLTPPEAETSERSEKGG